MCKLAFWYVTTNYEWVGASDPVVVFTYGPILFTCVISV